MDSVRHRVFTMLFDFSVVGLGITGIEILKSAPNIISFMVQISIGVLTIIYLLKKIKKLNNKNYE